MKKRLIGYWLATGLLCLAMTAGGSMNLIMPGQTMNGMKNYYGQVAQARFAR